MFLKGMRHSILSIKRQVLTLGSHACQQRSLSIPVSHAVSHFSLNTYIIIALNMMVMSTLGAGQELMQTGPLLIMILSFGVTAHQTVMVNSLIHQAIITLQMKGV